jgi:hypothetical protein
MPALFCGVVLLFLAVWHMLFFDAALPKQALSLVPAAGPDFDSMEDEESGPGNSATAARENASSATALKSVTWSALTWLVLLVPLLVAAYKAPSSFSSVAVIQRANSEPPSTFSLRGTSSTLPDPSGRPVYHEVSGILDMGDRPELTKIWEGKKVRTVAQFFPGEEEGTFRVVRFFMWCCASDSTALPVVVRGTDPLVSELKTMDWCDVTGTLRVKQTDKGPRAEIELDTITRSQRPAEPFLY